MSHQPRLDRPGSGRLLDARVVVRPQVVFREFATETVALDLVSGEFHSFDCTAGRMVDVVCRFPSAAAAVAALAAERGEDETTTASSLSRLLEDLADRALIVLS